MWNMSDRYVHSLYNMHKIYNYILYKIYINQSDLSNMYILYNIVNGIYRACTLCIILLVYIIGTMISPKLHIIYSLLYIHYTFFITYIIYYHMNIYMRYISYI